jgi:hypothetical protein
MKNLNEMLKLSQTFLTINSQQSWMQEARTKYKVRNLTFNMNASLWWWLKVGCRKDLANLTLLSPKRTLINQRRFQKEHSSSKKEQNGAELWYQSHDTRVGEKTSSPSIMLVF